MNNNYRVVERYYRQQHYEFWSRYRNPFYASTFDLDMTRLKAFTEERGYPLYVNLCYFMIRAMREIEDFRYRLLDGRVVLYDEIHPGLAVPAPGGLFTFAYYEYHPDVAVFNDRAREISEEASRGVELEDPEHRNGVWFTALPKVPFTSFTHATNLPTDTEPQIAFGKYCEQDGKLLVPVGLQVNHVLVDGNALGELVERAQRCYDEPG
ncbi:MAG: hypothetical protein GY719_21425 [bacterium]|nr:hypothetical protein [bacterium]